MGASREPYNGATVPMFGHVALHKALLFAHIEATRQGAAEIRPGHLLLGLRLGTREAVGRLLARISIPRARAALAPAAPDAAAVAQSTIPRSVETERLIARAVDEAAASGQPLTEEHLLLALFTDAACAQVLARGGVTEMAVRDRLTQRARTPVRLVVSAGPDPALDLTTYDPAQHTHFAWILTQPPLAGLGTLAAVLTNRSPQQVKALVARWTFTDADGDTRIHHIVVDDYFVYNRFPSLTSGRSVLVTPRGCVEPLTAGTGWCFVGPIERPEAAAVAATLEIDSAIFEDGRIVGPDTYDIGADIHGRHAAAVALLNEVRAAEDAGEDPEAALPRLARRAREAHSPAVGRRWHFPSHGAEWLKQLRDLPAPPIFVRT